jgi:hypothetical protein
MENVEPALMAKIKGARKWMLPLCCVAIWGILKTSDARAQVRPFYEDKTIRIVDYGTAGGGSDLLARLVARHLPKQIPGNPQVVVQNMAGPDICNPVLRALLVGSMAFKCALRSC